MNKWYLLNYVDHQNWLIDNLEKLDLNNDEALCLLCIQFLKKQKQYILLENLCVKLKKSLQEVNELLEELARKRYLTIKFDSKGLLINLSNLYETQFTTNDKLAPDSLFNLYQETFGKFLNNSDAVKLNSLIENYSRHKIVKAFQKACAYNRNSISYIEKILRDEN